MKIAMLSLIAAGLMFAQAPTTAPSTTKSTTATKSTSKSKSKAKAKAKSTTAPAKGTDTKKQ